MSSLPTFHDQTTTGDATASHSTNLTSHTPAIANTNTHPTTTTTTSTDPDAITSANNTVGTSDTTGEYRPRLNSEYEPTTSIDQPRGSLSSTVGPFQVPTTDDVSKSEVPPASSVGQQNAPGKGGELGEKAMGALGYGGTSVERPKEEQGIAEKIVNFLGA